MIITLLEVYIVIVRLMTLTLFQGHRCARNITANSVFLLFIERKKKQTVLCSLSEVCLLHTLKTKQNKKQHRAQHDVCDAGAYSGEIIEMFFVCQVSRFVENFNTGIYSDTIHLINVKVCMMILLIELYLFAPLPVIDRISKSEQCRTISTEIVVF